MLIKALALAFIISIIPVAIASADTCGSSPPGCNSYGCWKDGGGCNSYGCWKDGGGCNSYGCWSSPQGACNSYGCDDIGVCNSYGCP